MDVTILANAVISRPGCLSCHRKEPGKIEFDFTVLVNKIKINKIIYFPNHKTNVIIHDIANYYNVNSVFY